MRKFVTASITDRIGIVRLPTRADRALRLALILLLAALLIPAQELKPSSPASSGTDLPTAIAESQGYSSVRLEALRPRLHTGPSTAMMVLANGKIIFSYGDVAHVSKVASVRKSILSMLMGKYVVTGKLGTSKTVKQLGLDDQIPFTSWKKGRRSTS